MTVEEYQLALCLAGTTVRNSAGEERFVPLLEGVREVCAHFPIKDWRAINRGDWKKSINDYQNTRIVASVRVGAGSRAEPLGSMDKHLRCYLGFQWV